MSSFNIRVKRPFLPKETSNLLMHTLDNVMFLALSHHKSSPLAFNAHALLFVLFPRLILRPLPNGCQGGVAAAALSRRCSILFDGNVESLPREAQDAQTERVAKALGKTSAPKSSFLNIAIAAILARAVARLKLAFLFGMESNLVVAT